jgi:GNAT superfamily N-acetyltransferase
MDIALLADHIDALPALARWYRDEWEPYYGVEGPGDALADLQSRCNRDALPIGLVALEGDQVRGVAALDVDVATDLTPSVVGLLVAVEYRGQGVATQLLESAKSMGRRLGYGHVYISTTTLGEHLLKNGWQGTDAHECLPVLLRLHVLRSPPQTA